MKVKKNKQRTYKFWVKKLLSKNYLSNFKQVSGGFKLRICSSQDQCFRPVNYDDKQPTRFFV